MIYDLLIIGGGINGAAIAREAAIQGLSVLLVEKDDLASHTSSASTKLVHGGLRYLEYYEFKLVREALLERERLLAMAPHLIRPLKIVLPHRNAVRPWWLVRAGLLLYDLLAGKMSLPRSRGLRRSDSAFRLPLKDVEKGFVYSDAWADDARLVVHYAMAAAALGADVRTRTGLVSAARVRGVWQAQLSDGTHVEARAMVNAGGPWVVDMLSRIGVPSQAGVRLIKGSHIIVSQLFAGDHAYMLQQPDKRIVFAIPYEEGLTLIGTTDVAVEKPEDARISDDEITYLCEAANRYFKRAISPADVISTYAGVRPLYDDGASEAQSVTRDYVLELDANGPPVLSVFGGKITTARHLAEVAMEKLLPVMGRATSAPRSTAPLPGGILPLAIGEYERRVLGLWPFLGEARARRMARAYGSNLGLMLDGVNSAAEMGQDLGGGLTTLELNWLIEHEWAQTAEDVLWRRTKLGLSVPSGTAERVGAYLDSRRTQGSNPA